MFASQILADKPHLPLMTNHPKQGGIASFLGALGALSIAGREVHYLVIVQMNYPKRSEQAHRSTSSHRS